MAYTKLYTRVLWENEPSVKTPVNENNLNTMDFAINELDNRTLAMDVRITNLEDLEPTIQNYMNLAREAAKESDDSAVLSESWAVGGTNTRDGENTNNSKYYAGLAEKAVENAGDAIDKLSDDYAAYSLALSNEKDGYSDELDELGEKWAKRSESWAVGGTATRQGEDTDNSKYYSNLSSTHANNSQTYAEQAQTTLNNVVQTIDDALEGVIPEVIVDLDDGHLYWQGGRFNWVVSQTNGHLLWEVA